MRKGNLQKFINKAKKIHNNKYDYSLVIENEPKSVKSTISVICPIHGIFETSFDYHVNFKRGCPKCAGFKRTTDEFIHEMKEKNKDKNYSYECTKYIDSKTKVKVFCHNKDEQGNEHGIFEIRPDHLRNGHGCPKCCNRYITTEDWIKMARKVHGDKYDYSNVEYKNNETKVSIICPNHGEFFQVPYSHIGGNGCPKCNGGVSYNKDIFVEEANKVHNGYYSYDKFVYINANTPSTITCPRHGDFEQTPYSHVNMGHGCPKCKSSRLESILSSYFKRYGIGTKEQESIGLGKQTIDFYLPKYNIYVECQGEQHYIPTKFSKNQSDEDALKVLNDRKRIDEEKYNKVVELGGKMIYFTLPNDFHVLGVNVKGGFYSDKSVFTNADDLVKYVLDEGETNNDCGTHLCDFIKDVTNLSSEITVSFNRLKYRNNVIYFNLMNTDDSLKMFDRHRASTRRGNVTIDVFEDEYINHKDIVLSKIRHILRLEETYIKIDARKCIIQEIDRTEAKPFLEKNHIQGFVNSTVYYGCFESNVLVGVMTFLEEFNGKWNLSRFATKMGTRCRGVASKMLKFFINDKDPLEIKSFADKRWTPFSENNLYTKLGFKYDPNGGSTKEYRYWKDGVTKERQHKFLFRKETLHKKYGFPLTMTESEMTTALGYVKIWDCGLYKYVWRRKEENA